MSTHLVLQKCREQLQEVSSSSLNVERYREEISHELNIAVEQLKELHEAENRAVELEQNRAATKELPNKMEYSNVVKEMAVVKKKITELSNEINHSIRNNEVVVSNKVRRKRELDSKVAYPLPHLHMSPRCML